MTYRFWTLIAVFATLLLALNFLTATEAEGTPPHEGVCAVAEGEVKVDVPDGTPVITVTAPEGYQIGGYCVKAGSAQQGLGPEEYLLDEPADTVTISHSSGKDISHYVVHLTIVVVTPPPIDPSICPEGTVPGWLNEDGLPTGCVGNEPNPGVDVPEAEAPTPVVATPRFTG